MASIEQLRDIHLDLVAAELLDPRRYQVSPTYCDMCDAHPDSPHDQVRLCPECEFIESELGGDLAAVAKYLSHTDSIESEAERSLWLAYLKSPHTMRTVDLVPQHQVQRYRLDFADIGRKVAIEVDGLAYHNGQDSFIHDQHRQRDLQRLGWFVIRFAAKEALTHPESCLGEIRSLIQAKTTC